MDKDEELLNNLLGEEEEEIDEDIKEEFSNNNNNNNINANKNNNKTKQSTKKENKDAELLSEVLEYDQENQKNSSSNNDINNNTPQKKEKVNKDLNNIYPEINKKNNEENDMILPLLNDFKKNNKNEEKPEIPYQTLEERTFLTEQINKNKFKKKFNTQSNTNNNINNINSNNKKNNINKSTIITKPQIKKEELSNNNNNNNNKKPKEIPKIKLIKYKQLKPDKIEIEINEIVRNARKNRNNFDKVEEAYKILKPPMDEILSKPETNDQIELMRQNAKMLTYLDLLNKILALVSDNPIPIFKNKKNVKNKDANQLIEEEKKKIESNNEHIIKNYDKEIDHMKSILDKVRNETYEKNLDQDIKLRKEHLLITKKKIADIKLKIKQRELEHEHEQKKNKKQIKLKNLICDYKIKRKEKTILDDKLEKDKNNLITLEQLKQKYLDKIENKKKTSL